MSRSFALMALAGAAGAVVLLAAPLLAQGTRTPIANVKQTPLAHCVANSIRFVRHTRKALKFPGLRYCTDHDWDVVDVEHDGRNVYWKVPFDDSNKEYGAGDVYCICDRR